MIEPPVFVGHGRSQPHPCLEHPETVQWLIDQGWTPPVKQPSATVRVFLGESGDVFAFNLAHDPKAPIGLNSRVAATTIVTIKPGEFDQMWAYNRGGRR